jgi:hypothetical protein
MHQKKRKYKHDQTVIEKTVFHTFSHALMFIPECLQYLFFLKGQLA